MNLDLNNLFAHEELSEVISPKEMNGKINKHYQAQIK